MGFSGCGDLSESCPLESRTFAYLVPRWWSCMGRYGGVALLEEVRY